MEFSRPYWLLAVPGLALLTWWVVLGRRRSGRERDRFGVAHHPGFDRTWAWLFSMSCVVVALTGPRWGRHPAEERLEGEDVVLVIDVSRSMAAEDAVPDRLGLAREAAGEVIRAVARAPGSRVAVVAFAGRGVLRCPPTTNLGAALDTIASLRAGDVSPGGTDLAAAIAAGLDVLERSPGDVRASGTLVLISDGEDLEGGWTAARGSLAYSGVIVHGISIGDDVRGHPIPLEGSNDATLTYRGQPVLSRRSDSALASLAEETGGAFVPLGLAEPTGLADLFADRVIPTSRRVRETKQPPARVDRSRSFTLFALMFGAVACYPGRRRAFPVVLFTCLAVGAGPPGSTELSEAVRRGHAAYMLGDPARALSEYERAARLDPSSPVHRYNVAATLFRLGRYSEAFERYTEARVRADAGLRTKIDFALGNTAFALGDLSGSIRHYDNCLASTVPGAPYDEVRRDAGINREYVERSRSRDDPDLPPGVDSPRSDAGPGPQPESQDSRDSITASDPPRSASSPPEAATSPLAEIRSPTATPLQRLDEALRNARDARRRRLSEVSPPEADADRKNW